MRRVRVMVRTSFVGFHNWPEAPAERSYLAERHRHCFYVQAGVETQTDRQVEFHDLLDVVTGALPGVAFDGGRELGAKSCEEMAYEITVRLASKYATASSVVVWEDNECGAAVDWWPDKS